MSPTLEATAGSLIFQRPLDVAKIRRRRPVMLHYWAEAIT